MVKKFETVVSACKSGSERDALVAMRDLLAESMDTALSSVVAQISGRLQAILRAIAELDEREEAARLAAAAQVVSPLAELESLREARRRKGHDSRPSVV